MAVAAMPNLAIISAPHKKVQLQHKQITLKSGLLQKQHAQRAKFIGGAKMGAVKTHPKVAAVSTKLTTEMNEVRKRVHELLEAGKAFPEIDALMAKFMQDVKVGNPAGAKKAKEHLKKIDAV